MNGFNNKKLLLMVKFHKILQSFMKEIILKLLFHLKKKQQRKLKKKLQQAKKERKKKRRKRKARKVKKTKMKKIRLPRSVRQKLF